MLTQSQVLEAIEQMKVQCDLAMPEYRMLSARSTLYELGYEEHVEQVLAYIFEHGFTYCLDPAYHEGSLTKIEYSVCYWGPDQLKSRLDSLR